jgi:alpha-amylase/alpha-mannosidase (GH57 family)
MIDKIISINGKKISLKRYIINLLENMHEKEIKKLNYHLEDISNIVHDKYFSLPSVIDMMNKVKEFQNIQLQFLLATYNYSTIGDKKFKDIENETNTI